ncbi:MAG: Ig-like domain-containing protein [bacterium]
MATSAIVLGVLSCGGSKSSAPTSTAGAIEINPPAPTLALNATLALQAQLKNASGSIVDDAVIVWSVRDPSIVSVSSTGLVTALALGTTQVAASSQGKSALSTITVLRTPVATVVLRPDRVDAVVGSLTQLIATALDASQGTLVGRGFIWTTSNASVATVDATGLVTGIGPGSAAIAATSEGKSAQSTFSIIQGAIASVTVAPNPITMVAGQSTQLAVSARDAGGSVVTGKPVVWSSSNTSLASVSPQGVVTAVGAGSTTITATIEGVSGTTAVTVSNVPVAKVDVSPQGPTLSVASSTQLATTVTDANGAVVTNRVVGWVSSNATVATVSSTGVVTGLAPGTATITATSEGTSGSTTVTVTLVPVGSVSVSPSTLSLTPAQTGTFTATVTDANGSVVTNRPVAWSTSDAAIATVSQTGVVTAVGPGSATITAASGGKSGTAAVTVAPVPVASVVVAPSTLSLAQGQTGALAATVTDANGVVVNGPVAWTTSDASIASVSQAGVVAAVAVGAATISATSGGQSGAATVTVGAVPVASVTVSPAASTLTAGQSTTLSATVIDANGATIVNATVTWSSSDASIAAVASNGVVTTTAPGSATITATSGGKSGAATITVNPATVTPGPAARVTVTPGLASVKKKKTVQLSATAVDAQGRAITGRAFIWTTGASSTATVDGTGLVTGEKSGLVAITAKLDNATGTALISVQ